MNRNGELNFTVDYDWFTAHIRERWANNRKDYVKEVLLDCGLSNKHIRQIVNGQLRMEAKDSGFILVDDNWKWEDYYEWYGGIKKEDSLETGFDGCGYIAPNGFFYSCAYREHRDLLRKFELTELEAEEEGWIKIGSTYVRRGEKIPNKKQLNKLIDWCITNKCGYLDLKTFPMFTKKELKNG